MFDKLLIYSLNYFKLNIILYDPVCEYEKTKLILQRICFTI